MTDQTPPRHTISREDFDAVIFDLDGVVTRTASLHFAAWKRLFDAFLQLRTESTGEEFSPFTEEDYRQYVDGKPRYDGVQSFLAARGILLPHASPEDPSEGQKVISLGNRKNEYFQEELNSKGPQVFASSIRLIRALRHRGFKIGLVSSSKNSASILDIAGIAACFDAKVDGIDMENIHLPGKPAPDVFLLAAEELGVDPVRSVVVEDAMAGVEAGRRGHFGLVIGVARDGDPEALHRAGADIVVADLAEIGIEEKLLPPATSTAMLPSALNSFAGIAGQLAGRRPVIFLDYDGTLTPIVKHPQQAVLSEEMRETVRRLARQTKVAVVSGRDLEDIRRMVGLEEVYYAGSHGFDIAGPAGEQFTFQQGFEFLSILEQAGQELGEQLDGLTGVWLERKKFALALHFREADEGIAGLLPAIVDGVLASHPGLRKSGGKKIIELRPAINWDKGRAVVWLLNRMGLEGPEVLPLYLGDDLTDEDAFRELQVKGIGIVVRDETRPTAALFALDHTGQVRDFLERLASWLEQRA
jgi:trehalose-phosphatase